MADKKATFADEINSRLGEFFGDADKSDVPAPITNHVPQENSELSILQEIILSIEWEISDKIMERLIAETNRLINIYRDNKVIYSLLKLLHTVGRYINAKKATALPDSIKLLHSIHAGLQKVANSKTITEMQSRRILSAEIAKFKNLKQQLLTKTEPPPSKDIKSAAKTTTAPIEPTQTSTPTKEVSAAATPDLTINPPKDAALQAIDELKILIQKEFKSLREELKQLHR